MIATHKYLACYNLLRNDTYELKLVVNTEANSPFPVNEGDYDATLGFWNLAKIRSVMTFDEMVGATWSADMDPDAAGWDIAEAY